MKRKTFLRWMVCGVGLAVLLLGVQAFAAPPVTPANPVPADGATGVSVANATLTWDVDALKRNKVIYGDDDRLDVYQVTDPALLAAADSTVVLLSTNALAKNGDGTYSIPATTFNEDYNGQLCPDEPYRDQPDPGFCSGFLVAPDIIASAGHCVTSTGECGQTAFVFGFHMLDADTPVLTVPESEVYFCEEIIDRVQIGIGADWGLFRLDRPVVGHEPLPIRRSGRIADNQPVIVMGYPVGLPLKIAGGANVRDNSPLAFFVANLDTYGGNSGSAVINAQTLAVEGILVRGDTDFVFDSRLWRRCYESNVVSDDAGRGEDVTRTTEFADLVPPAVNIPYSAVYFAPAGQTLQYVGVTDEGQWALPLLEPATSYSWKIVNYSADATAAGPVWSFTTVTNQRAISITTDGGGHVQVDDVDHTLPWAASYPEGTTLTIEAIPDPGFRFVEWSGYLEGNTPLAQVTLNDSASIHVSFISEDDDVVQIPDDGLEAAIRIAVGKPDGDLLESDLEGLISLDASSYGIYDLTGLEHCAAIEELDLRFNQLADLTPLTGLTTLKWLILWNNNIVNLGPLGGLTNLEYLDLDENQVADLTPLGTLTKLERLYLSGNQVASVAPLSTAIALNTLALDGNQVTDLQGLVDNSGMGDSDVVALYSIEWGSNPLSQTARRVQIPALKARGVTVIYKRWTLPDLLDCTGTAEKASVPSLNGDTILLSLAVLALGGSGLLRRKSRMGR